ncbi:MAG: hypothetical protein ACOC0C_04340 [Bacteroidota bacterium]
MDENGTWKFAPVYDLNFSYSSHGHHSTMVAGESLNPGQKHLLELAKYFGIKKPQEIIQQVRDVLTHWKQYANEAGVTKNSIQKIGSALSKIR